MFNPFLGFKPRTKSALCVNGDWLTKPTVCDKDPDFVEWDPSLSTCSLPKRANKENTSGGKWHCKAQLINPNERSVESERALAQEEGYQLITERSTIQSLVDDDFLARWKKSNKGKEPFVICKLKCHDGYELEGKIDLITDFYKFRATTCQVRDGERIMDSASQRYLQGHSMATGGF